MATSFRQPWILLLICAVMFLTRLGATRLWDDDETYFAQCAVEMQNRNDLLIPYFNGEIFVHKPPVMYWGMIAAFKIFGVNEFAARFPSAIFGCGSVLLVYFLGRRIFSAAAGFWSGAILATCLNFNVISRAAAPDAELTFFTMLPLFLFVRGTTRRALPGSEPVLSFEGTWRTDRVELPASVWVWLACYAAMGTAVMVKGPIGIILPTCVLGLFLLCWRTPAQAAMTAPVRAVGRRIWQWCSPWRVLKTAWGMRPVTGLLVLLAVAGPWYLWVSLATKGVWPAGFFGVHHFSRFATPLEGHGGSMWYYPAAICVGFFPWILLIGPVVWHVAARLRQGHAWQPGYVLALCWCAVWIGFFTLAGTKLPHYVIPAYPAIALLTGSFVAEWIAGKSEYRQPMQYACWGTLAILGLGFLGGLPWVLCHYGVDDPWLGLTGLPAVLGAVFGYRATRSGSPRRVATVLLATGLTFVLGILGIAAVRIDKYQSSPALAELVRGQCLGGTPALGEWRHFRPSLVFYGGEKLHQCATPDEVRIFFAQHPERAFLFTTAEDYAAAAFALPENVVVLGRHSRFPKTGEIWVLGRSEDARHSSRLAAH